MATKITLRSKPIKDRYSLFLDYYPPVTDIHTGKPIRKEYLKIHISKPLAEAQNEIKNESILKRKFKPYPDFAADKEKINLARKILEIRKNEVEKPEIYNALEKKELKKLEMGEIDFLKYFLKQANKRKRISNQVWLSAYNFLTQYFKNGLKFKQVNAEVFNDFKDYLLNTKSVKSDKYTLSTNTAQSYFNKVKIVLKQAYVDNILENDLNPKISTIKGEETKKEFLTLEELKKLAETPISNQTIRNAALFSCLTGFRFGDISKLRWINIDESGDYVKVNIKQSKTKDLQYQPISNEAFELCGERKDNNDLVFKNLNYHKTLSELKKWVHDAGIVKNIGFHSLRHTYATLQLASGTDIYTVSKMLGHKNVKTTQIYAKVVDEMKLKTLDKISITDEK